MSDVSLARSACRVQLGDNGGVGSRSITLISCETFPCLDIKSIGSIRGKLKFMFSPRTCKYAANAWVRLGCVSEIITEAASFY